MMIPYSFHKITRAGRARGSGSFAPAGIQSSGVTIPGLAPRAAFLRRFAAAVGLREVPEPKGLKPRRYIPSGGASKLVPLPISCAVPTGTRSRLLLVSRHSRAGLSHVAPAGLVFILGRVGRRPTTN